MSIRISLELSHTQFFNIIYCIDAQIYLFESTMKNCASEYDQRSIAWKEITEAFDRKIADLNGIKYKLYDAFASRCLVSESGDASE